MDFLPSAIGVLVALACLVALLLIRRRISKPNSKNRNVDPLAEAEVYLAYGRKKEAIQLLRAGLANHPNRTDIAAKLSKLEK
jgi:predicted Zn-dependent protease